MHTVNEKRARFRRLHASGFFILPNAWDRESAVRLSALGFQAIASTSSGAALAVGKQDGELGLEATLEHLRLLVAATPLPVNADFEHGFADDPEALARNVMRAAETGVAAVSIEDWSGRALYEQAFAVERLQAARAALDVVDPKLMLIGRHEHFRAPSLSIADSIARAVAYAEAGADCLFVPLILDPGAVAELVAAVAPKPVNVVVQRYDESIRALVAAGVRRCSVGGSLARRGWSGFDEAAEALKRCDAFGRDEA
jgi:2-methylisocitrate lyase-like PEP mutase family enzyme